MPASPPPLRAFLLYNAARVAMLAVALGVLYLAGARGPFLVLAALLVSGVVSWFTLGRQREAVSEGVERFYRERRARLAARTAAEDAAAEAYHLTHTPPD